MAYRFFALPQHLLVSGEAVQPEAELFEPELPPTDETVEGALAGAEFRDERARDRLRKLTQSDKPDAFGPVGEGFSPSGLFAQPPNDLPALLRLADKLDDLAKSELGERALIWRCECGTRYAVPVALVRPVAIKCERCGRSLELNPTRSLGEEALLEPARSQINKTRHALSSFFREAMARNLPVLVSHR